MKKTMMILAVACLFSGKAVAGGVELKPTWSDGIKLEAEDKSFSFRINGRIQEDFIGASVDKPLAKIYDGVETRRAYLGVSGTIYDNIEMALQYDFAPATAKLRDGYVGVKTDFVNVRVGHMKEPFSLEQLTSDLNTTFMERSLGDKFAPGYQTGAMLFQDVLESRATYALGVFKTTDDQGKGQAEGNHFNVTGRLTGLPYADGDDLIHLGLAGSLRKPEGDSVAYSAKPEANLANALIKTTVTQTLPDGTKKDINIVSDQVTLMGAEAAAVFGPASLQGEYMMADVSSDTSDDPKFTAWYILGSYFLTGEHRPYKKAAGAFDRVKPEANFLGKDNGPGAWELALRYSSMDLDKGNVHGGKLNDITAGVNWYLNPNTKVMFNYVNADVKDLDARANIFETRFQVDF